jgi:hypothetical protein
MKQSLNLKTVLIALSMALSLPSMAADTQRIRLTERLMAVSVMDRLSPWTAYG